MTALVPATEHPGKFWFTFKVVGAGGLTLFTHERVATEAQAKNEAGRMVSDKGGIGSYRKANAAYVFCGRKDDGAVKSWDDRAEFYVAKRKRPTPPRA